MPSKITRELLESHLRCKYKGWLRLSGQNGSRSDYETLLSESRAEVRRRAIEKIRAQHAYNEIARNVSLNTSLLRRGAFVILDAVLEDSATCLLFDGLKRVQGSSKLGDYHYVPMLFDEGRQVRREQKSLLEVYALLLSKLQDQAPW